MRNRLHAGLSFDESCPTRSTSHGRSESLLASIEHYYIAYSSDHLLFRIGLYGFAKKDAVGFFFSVDYLTSLVDDDDEREMRGITHCSSLSRSLSGAYGMQVSAISS